MKKRAEAERDFLGEYERAHSFAVRESFLKLGDCAQEVGQVLASALRAGQKVMVFGNGGSATQASHFAAELMGRFSKTPRRPLAAVALASDPGIITCIGNDFGYDAVFERQIAALGKPGDIALALTTSGKSENVLRGLAMARRKRATTVALAGAAGLAGVKPDYLLNVPSTSTNHIQEVHILFLHLWCSYIDKALGTRPRAGSRRRSRRSHTRP
jgi:D-sedoheptulose 7-phosphate isomerase